MKKTTLLIAGMLALSMGMLQAADAKTNWAAKCAGCHGKEGKGDTKLGIKMGARDYSDPKVQDSIKDEAIIKALKEGVKKDGKQIMKAYTDTFTENEIKELAAFMRTLKKK
ncbi:MAG TPA: cytochrome c [Candidatus Paceibacterota bacterium]|nr:cytochrome c [Verrucomicrobiota bacterium]HRY48105.1 cytochrome c [Candidatus Paceibacterota bacterium]HSA00644.1 cytochrome c [Candidatus Paceibacterota bacterium]